MSSFLNDYRRVWVLDTEFRTAPGERNSPVCLCARDRLTGDEVEVFFDHHQENPFDYDGTLFVGFNTPAEWKTFLALDWKLPPTILDLDFEYPLKKGRWSLLAFLHLYG